MLYLGTSASLVPGWAGSFRHVELPQRVSLDRYSQEFNTCELAIPQRLSLQPVLALPGLRRCRPGFQFTVKAPSGMTQGVPGDESLFAAFNRALEPLRGERRLGCVLVPFPAYFEFNQRHRDYLLLFQERLRETPLAVEFHSRSWLRRDALAWLHWHRLSLCWGDSVLPTADLPLQATGGMAYIRLRVGTPSPPILAGDAFQLNRWLPWIRELTSRSEKTFVLVTSLQGRALDFLRKLKTVLVGSSVARPEGTGLLFARRSGTGR